MDGDEFGAQRRASARRPATRHDGVGRVGRLMLVQPGEGLGRGEMGHSVEDEGRWERKEREVRTGQE